MPDSTFESLLSGQLRAYAEAGVRPFDRYAIAEETISGGLGAGFGERLRGRSWAGRLSLVLVGLLVLALAATIALVGSRLWTPLPHQLPHSYDNEFVSGPDLPTPLAHPVLVPLVDGRVLAIGAGGDGGDPTSTAVLYDPATGASVSSGPMVSPDRFVSSAVRLVDGRVLIVGDAVIQLFDPTTLRFAAVGPMLTPRSGPAMVVLRDGRVLIAGGSVPGQGTALRSAEVFDPDTLTFSTTGSMSAAGAGAAMATLPDGRVFVASNPTAEVYDPGTGIFSAAGAMPNFGATASIVMPDGRVAVLGLSGLQSDGHVAVWDPTSQTFSAVFDGPEPIFGATLLDDGRILMTGGRLASWSGIYDPTTGATTEITPPTAWRPSSARLADGRVLVVGGLTDGNVRPGPGGGGVMASAVPTVEIFR